STWSAYNNHYWPADYLIDANGSIRYTVFGEGDYAQTEQAIRQLLQSAGYSLPSNLTNFTSSTNFSQIGTSEIYLGYATIRAPIGNTQGFSENKTVNYTATNVTQPNIVYFYGEWYNAPDGMIAVNNSKLFMVYRAKDVNIVASGNNSRVNIILDGKNLTQAYLGSDVSLSSNGTASAVVNQSRLYNIVNASSYGAHALGIDAGPGFKIYTFTFG
ncbi:MAG: thiol-disulfide isomerase, partial [Candidatus Micrarchaeaceae archaeon]